MDALGIDIGSTNVKVVLVRDDGVTLGAAQRPLTWERQGEAAEQDAAALWDAVLEALDDLAAAAGPSVLGGVGAVGLCGQYSSIVPVDAEARPLAPMRLYLDQRGTPHCRAILERHEAAFATWLERHPIPPVGGGLALGHLLAFQLDEPGVHERTAAYLEPVDYVAARLTGVLAATQGSMFAGQLIDNRTLGATAYDAELVAMAGVDPRRLPRLVEVGEVIGTVRPDLATRIGLGAAVPVLTGITDSCGQALATGADRPGRVGIAIGTTGVILSAVDALGADLDHEVLAMPGVRTDRYLVSAENGIAGRAVEHVLEHLVHASDALGSHAVADAFDGFEEALAASPSGARGVRFLPWLSGSMSPQADASVRGGFVGVSLDTRRVDLVRATAEGVAHNLRWLLPPVEDFTGQAAEEVVLTGGAARSPRWSQVLADVLQRPVRTVREPGHSGARATAGWALDQLSGTHGDWVGTDRTYDPHPATAEIHAHAQQQFTATFDALRPLGLGSRPPT
ncbi:FGGY family carbohydrate kinase [Aquihabitans daechungensis]|uniref:FGGY family carbohydrate kinase n=1 Tax=Aquihabitans daechungensis TaxID=1052257 RepID=UPI003BA25459